MMKFYNVVYCRTMNNEQARVRDDNVSMMASDENTSNRWSMVTRDAVWLI
jgi:hypothetical protein